MAPPTGQVPAVVDASADIGRSLGARRPTLELVRPPRRLRPGLIGTIVVSLVFGTLFVLAAMQAILVQGQLRLDRVHQDIEDRQETVDKLATEVATLEAPARIQQVAAEFGMVQPPDVVFLAPTTVEPLPPDTAPDATAPAPDATTPATTAPASTDEAASGAAG